MQQFTGLSSSFVQESKHVTKTNKFQHVTPAMIANVAKQYGFDLVSLKTGNARNADRAAHQTTIARYRSTDQFQISGLYVDLIFKVPHLYGAIEGILGTYRQVCSNGLAVGVKFETIKVKHLGNPVEELFREIPRLVAQRSQLAETIKRMQGTYLNDDKKLQLAREIGAARLASVGNVNWFDYAGLIKIERPEDSGDDLFSVFNRIQEQIVRTGLRYTFQTTDFKTGQPIIKNATARRLTENTSRSVSFNSIMWDHATSKIAA